MILPKTYRFCCLVVVCGLCVAWNSATAQNLSATDTAALATARIPFLQAAPQPHKGRIVGVSAVSGVSYTAGMLAVSRLWYAQYPQTRFHFFDDNAGWLQIDKVGHAWTAYNQAIIVSHLYRWSGLNNRQAAWLGFGLGNVFQGGIELLDGYSVGWGASVGDIAANVSGTSLMLGQQLAWGEQRIWLKYSSHRAIYSNYPSEVQDRALALYGSNWGERLLKDYNGQSYWLSVNPSAFMRHRPDGFPQWLNIAVGYGADGMLGAESNTWYAANDSTQLIDYRYIPRSRQYYLSLDVDFSRIPTRSRWLRMLFVGLNTLKFPAPTLAYDSRSGFAFHPVYW